MPKTKLIAVSKIVDQELLQELKSDSAEELIMYAARVSNPKNQTSGNTKLLNYCLNNKHWSIFEQASMTVEITTSRAISAQILRHRSFQFQEFSQRYSKIVGVEEYDARRQDKKNRQNSIDDLPENIKKWFKTAQEDIRNFALALYEDALEKQIAKEQARFLLPAATTTKLYMTGNLRSWINYLQVRTGPETQLEHRVIAEDIKKLFCNQFPVIAEALEWK